jgi:hypothetical protein
MPPFARVGPERSIIRAKGIDAKPNQTRFLLRMAQSPLGEIKLRKIKESGCTTTEILTLRRENR